jgi:hypothetical protein
MKMNEPIQRTLAGIPQRKQVGTDLLLTCPPGISPLEM